MTVPLEDVRFEDVRFEGLQVEDRAPWRAAILALYDAVKWTGYTVDPDRLMRAFLGSTYVTCAFDGDALVGLARAVSDEATVWFLQDLLVLPSHQSAGIGRALLERCAARFEDVNRGVLLTDDAAHGFYVASGWERAETRGVVTCWINRSTRPE